MLTDRPTPLKRLTDTELLVLLLAGDSEEAPWMVMSDFQWRVVDLLMSILHLYAQRRALPWYLSAEINVFMPAPVSGRALPVVPDLFMAEAEDRERTSWRVAEEGPPLFALEVVSEESRQRDLEEKPALYDTMGVRELAIFDPHRRDGGPALFGYRRGEAAAFVPWTVDAQGTLWSETLGLGLYRAAGDRLRVRDRTGVVLPSSEEEAARAEAEAIRAEKEAARAEAEAIRAEEGAARAEAEARRADVAEAELARLRARLDQQGQG